MDTSFFWLVVAVVAQDAAVGVEDAAFGDEAEVVAAGVDYGQAPGAGGVEFFHNGVHVFADEDAGRGRGHEGGHVHLAVEVGAEHDVADFIQGDDAEELAGGVEHGEDIAVRLGNFVDHFFEGHLGTDAQEVGFDYGVHLQQGEHGLVLLVCEEFALFGEAGGIDAIGLEEFDGAVGDG